MKKAKAISEEDLVDSIIRHDYIVKMPALGRKEMKLLPIDSCFDCVHQEDRYKKGQVEYWCIHPNIVHPRLIGKDTTRPRKTFMEWVAVTKDEIGSIPSWCLLEDAEVKDEH